MNSSITRERMLASIAAVVAFGLPTRLLATSKIIRIGAIASDVSAQPHYAQAQGFYRRAGLDAQVSTFPNGGAIIAGVASGALDVGFGNLTSIAAARQRGLPVRLVSAATLYLKRSPVTVLVRARGAKLQSGADLRGKTIAVSTLKGELQVGASAWIDKTGGDSTQAKFLELPFSAMSAALGAGRIDAAMLTEPLITQNKDTVEILSDAYTAIADEFLIGGFIASENWIHDNPDATRQFALAMHDTARWANTHRDDTAVILARESKLDEKLVRAMTRATYGERLEAEMIQPVLDCAFKYGSLKAAMTAKELLA